MHEVIETTKECIKEWMMSRSSFTLLETLESIEESRAAEHDGNCDQLKVHVGLESF